MKGTFFLSSILNFKTNSMRRNKCDGLVILIGATVLSFVALAACHKSEGPAVDNRPYTISGNATGSQMVPPVPDSANATITGTYNPANHVLNFTSNWNNLSGNPTIAGFYNGAPGASGVAVGDSWAISGGPTGTITGNVSLSETQAAELLKGDMYYTYGTLNHPTGEIRGQISVMR